MLTRVLLLSAITLISVSCADTTPREMSLADPNNRELLTETDDNLQSMQRVCAENMLNASPASEAINISPRVMSNLEEKVIEVDALLVDIGYFKEDLPVTYLCKFKNGTMTYATWVRGFGKKSDQKK